MHLNKRFLMLALAAVAAAAMFAIPSSASAAEHGSCTFNGLAGNISPGVMLAGGSGSYDFETTDPATTLCSVGPAGTPSPSEIKSVGNFENIVCGTGTAWSGFDDPQVTPTDPNGDDMTTINVLNTAANPDITAADYTISFEGAQGQLDVINVDDADSPQQNDHLPVNGHISIVPAEGGCSEPGGVTAFTVAGSFRVVYGPLP